jgi:hypothetical protein
MEERMAPENDGSDRRESGYTRTIESKIRSATLATRLRGFGVQLLWIVVVLAGAGVPLNQALGGPRWVGPVLGFVVVVAAGVERIFSRTTVAAAAHDELRRSLEQEKRLFTARAGSYAGSDAPFAAFASRCEEIIGKHDQTLIAEGRKMTKDAG